MGFTHGASPGFFFGELEWFDAFMTPRGLGNEFAEAGWKKLI
jgi:hypothetical protein